MSIVKTLASIFIGNDFTYRLNVKEAKKIGVEVGNNCRFIGTSKSSFSTEPYLISIGNRVSMTRPKFITHDGSVWVFRESNPNIDLFGTISVGDNCFIGENAIILPNTRIGNNCIIGAYSVVKGIFEDNSVIAGVPAKRLFSIQEYFDKNKDKFMFIRDKNFSEKKGILQKHFNLI